MRYLRLTNFLAPLITGIIFLLCSPSIARAKVIFSDTFTEYGIFSVILSVHTPDIGDNWGHVIGLFETCGSVITGSDTYVVENCIGGDSLAYTANVSGGYSSADYRVTIDSVNAVSETAYSWLIVRYQDSNNFYSARWTSGSGQIFKNIGGSWTGLGSFWTGGVSNGDTVRFTVQGSTLTFENITTSTVLDTLTDSDITVAGEAGFGIGDLAGEGNDWTSGQEMDNFEVDTIVSETTQVTGGSGKRAYRAMRAAAMRSASVSNGNGTSFRAGRRFAAPSSDSTSTTTETTLTQTEFEPTGTGELTETESLTQTSTPLNEESQQQVLTQNAFSPEHSQAQAEATEPVTIEEKRELKFEERVCERVQNRFSEDENILSIIVRKLMRRWGFGCGG